MKDWQKSIKDRNKIKSITERMMRSRLPVISVIAVIAVAGSLITFNIVTGGADSVNEAAASGIGGVGEFAAEGADKTALDKDEKLKEQLMSDSESEVSTDDEPAKNETGKIEYVVKNGDTLSEIASKYNVSVGAVAGTSGIRAIDELKVGQQLYIPTKDGFFYTVKKNDRLANILKKYDVSLDEFLADNHNIDIDIPAKGDEVFLPGAKPKNLIHGWLIPVRTRYVTSNYGWRRWPRKAFHKGLDLKAPYISVKAAKRGRVKYAGWLGGYGKVVIITHANGYKTLYAHLSRIYVRKGMRVGRGRIIGRSGNTGYSFGPHLHFEVSQRGRSLNPRSILKGLRN